MTGVSGFTAAPVGETATPACGGACRPRAACQQRDQEQPRGSRPRNGAVDRHRNLPWPPVPDRRRPHRLRRSPRSGRTPLLRSWLPARTGEGNLTSEQYNGMRLCKRPVRPAQERHRPPIEYFLKLSVREVAPVVLEDQTDHGQDERERRRSATATSRRQQPSARPRAGRRHEQRPPAVRAEEAQLAGAVARSRPACRPRAAGRR